MARLLTEMSAAPDFALNMTISQTAVVADDIGKELYHLYHSHMTYHHLTFLLFFSC